MSKMIEIRERDLRTKLLRTRCVDLHVHLVAESLGKLEFMLLRENGSVIF